MNDLKTRNIVMTVNVDNAQQWESALVVHGQIF